MKLSPEQIAAVAHRAGFRGKGLVRAVAVALAESGGDTRAVGRNHDSRRTRDRGLWQINSYWHREVSDAEAFNPDAAARHAYRISKGGRDWSQWSTWKNGAAAAQYGRARVAVARQSRGTTKAAQNGAQAASWWGGAGPELLEDVPGGRGALGLLGGDSPLDSARSALVLAVRAGAWISDPHNWTRVAMVAGGSVGVLLALRMIAESGAGGSTAQNVAAIPGKAAGSAANLASTLIPAGKAAKALKAVS